MMSSPNNSTSKAEKSKLLWRFRHRAAMDLIFGWVQLYTCPRPHLASNIMFFDFLVPIEVTFVGQTHFLKGFSARNLRKLHFRPTDSFSVRQALDSDAM